MSGIDFENALNSEQLAAVQAPDGPVLVIAAAGTGKTRALTYRVAWLVERGIDPRRILLLTFTNKASREMLERARMLVGESVGGLWGGTFHHMANRMLRQHADLLGYRSDYTILDSDDTKKLVKGCLEEQGGAKEHAPKPDVLLSLFGLASSLEKPVSKLAEEWFESHEMDLNLIVKVHKLFQERKRGLNAMDFDDLLMNGLVLFREHPDVLTRYRERFQHILVDEYQDTNPIQAEWVDTLAVGHRNLLVVGDDFQSIYSWRGADFKNIMTFPVRYPDAQIYKLETNYRSVPDILYVANACIAGNPDQFQKQLRPVRTARHKPTVALLRDGDAQAAFIVQTIRRLKAGGLRLSDTAVLYRSHFHALELQLLLTRERIPYVITSGIRFFEQAHIKDVCAPLRLMANPADGLAFARLFELLPKMGPKTVSKTWQKMGGRFNPVVAEQRVRLSALLPAGAKEGWVAMEEYFALCEAEQLRLDPARAIKEFVAAFYDQYAIEQFDNYQRRTEDLQGLAQFMSRFESLEAFLSEVALLTNMDAETETPEGTETDAVRMSTVHQAKGLEWKAVFVLWLVENMFPSSRSMEDGATDEERRLFYVAVTRAQDELYLCVPGYRRTKDGGGMQYEPSRFVEEIPVTLVREDRTWQYRYC